MAYCSWRSCMLLLSLAPNGTRDSSKKSFHCLRCLLKSFALGSQSSELGLEIWIKVLGYNCVSQSLLCACLSDVGFCTVFVFLFFPPWRHYTFSLSPFFIFYFFVTAREVMKHNTLLENIYWLSIFGISSLGM